MDTEKLRKILKKLCDDYIHHSIAGNPNEWKKTDSDIDSALAQIKELEVRLDEVKIERIIENSDLFKAWLRDGNYADVATRLIKSLAKALASGEIGER